MTLYSWVRESFHHALFIFCGQDCGESYPPKLHSFAAISVNFLYFFFFTGLCLAN
jgi:hypothetical protein